MKIKELIKLTGIPVLFASMCCLSPLLLFLFGFSTLSFATSLADTFYGDYKWYFRGFGIFLFLISLFFYFKQKGICTLSEVKRNRNKIINTIIISLTFMILAYMFFLYVIVHYWGVFLNIW